MISTTEPSQGIILKASHVVLKRGNKEILENLTLTLFEHTVSALMGSNGSGKTSTLLMFAGMLAPIKGNLVFMNAPLYTHPYKAKKKLGFVPDKPYFPPFLTTKEILFWLASCHNIKRDQQRHAFHRVINECGLSDLIHIPFGELSRGLQKRVGIAAALLHQPQLLLLDEPTADLDPHQREKLLSLLKTLSSYQTILFSTHSTEDVNATGALLWTIEDKTIIPTPLSKPDEFSPSTLESIEVNFQ